LSLASHYYSAILVPSAAVVFKIAERGQKLVHRPCLTKDWHGITFAVAIVVGPILNDTFECHMINLTSFLRFFELIYRSTLQWQD
jgi:hypothetical protein